MKAAGGVRDLDGLIRVRDLGASRCGETATAAMLDEFRRREREGQPTAASGAPARRLLRVCSHAVTCWLRHKDWGKLRDEAEVPGFMEQSSHRRKYPRIPRKR